MNNINSMKMRVCKMVEGCEYIVKVKNKKVRLKLLKIVQGQNQNGNGNEPGLM